MTILPSLIIVCVVAAPVLFGCNISGAARGAVDVNTRLCYATADGELVHSTLVATPGSDTDRFTSMTALGFGARLLEEAAIDRSGRLVSASARLEQPGEKPAIRVRLDPPRGSIEISSPTLHVEWTVANDLPWVWVPLLTEPSAGAPLATPLDAQVVLRAAATGLPVRRLDLGVLTAQTVAADQILVRDGAKAIVILGDDAIEMEGGLPRRVRLAALEASLELVTASSGSEASDALAVAGCKAASPSFVH